MERLILVVYAEFRVQKEYLHIDNAERGFLVHWIFDMSNFGDSFLFMIFNTQFE